MLHKSGLGFRPIKYFCIINQIWSRLIIPPVLDAECWILCVLENRFWDFNNFNNCSNSILKKKDVMHATCKSPWPQGDWNLWLSCYSSNQCTTLIKDFIRDLLILPIWTDNKIVSSSSQRRHLVSRVRHRSATSSPFSQKCPESPNLKEFQRCHFNSQQYPVSTQMSFTPIRCALRVFTEIIHLTLVLAALLVLNLENLKCLISQDGLEHCFVRFNSTDHI